MKFALERAAFLVMFLTTAFTISLSHADETAQSDRNIDEIRRQGVVMDAKGGVSLGTSSGLRPTGSIDVGILFDPNYKHENTGVGMHVSGEWNPASARLSGGVGFAAMNRRPYYSLSSDPNAGTFHLIAAPLAFNRDLLNHNSGMWHGAEVHLTVSTPFKNSYAHKIVNDTKLILGALSNMNSDDDSKSQKGLGISGAAESTVGITVIGPLYVGVKGRAEHSAYKMETIEESNAKQVTSLKATDLSGSLVVGAAAF